MRLFFVYVQNDLPQNCLDSPVRVAKSKSCTPSDRERERKAKKISLQRLISFILVTFIRVMYLCWVHRIHDSQMLFMHLLGNVKMEAENQSINSLDRKLMLFVRMFYAGPERQTVGRAVIHV